MTAVDGMVIAIEVMVTDIKVKMIAVDIMMTAI